MVWFKGRGPVAADARPVYEAGPGRKVRLALFGGGVLVLIVAVFRFTLHDFVTYFFLWPASALALWNMGYAVLGNAEVWRFEDDRVVVRRSNCLRTVEQAWLYNQIREARVPYSPVEGATGRSVELLVGARWLRLPEQADRAAAERMLADIRARLADTAI